MTGWFRVFASMLLVFGVLVPGVELRAGEIPLVVNGNGPDAIWPAAVKCGVPFPQNTLMPGDPVVLVDDSNAPQPLQTFVTATWDPKAKKGVRWLLVDFSAERGKSYRLLFGADAQKARPRTRRIARVTRDGIVINTDLLRANCSLKRLDLFASLAGKATPYTSSDDWAGPYIEHETRGLFRADLDKDAQIIVEENGPMRATLKADGWYTNAQGEKFCRFSMRVHFFRGRTDVRLDHTFLFTGHSNDDRLRDVGVRLPLAGQAGEGSRYVFSAMDESEDATSAAVTGAGPSHVYQVMDSPDHHTLMWQAFDAATEKKIGNGLKTGGWMHVGTDQSSVLAAVRDAWQQYPIEFEWDATVATVHLWPKHGRMWDTSFDGYWYYLNDAQKQYLIEEKSKVGKVDPEKLAAALRQSDAVGAAKTHELWLRFGLRGDWATQSAAYADALTIAPIFAHADLQWQTASRALDWLPHHPYDMTNFADEENFLASIPGMMRLHSEVVHYYGWWDWSAYAEGIHLSWKSRRPSDLFEPWRAMPHWHRAKPKSHYYLGSFPWTMYYRTGQIQWLRYAQRFTLYSSERVHQHHTDLSVKREAGEEFHYDNSEIHWLGGGRGHPNRTGLLNPLLDKHDYVYQYWLTGDRRALDVLNMWGEMYKNRMAKDDALMRRHEEGGPFGGYHRSTGQFLNRLCILYEATWDEGYLKQAGRLADLFRGVDAYVSLRTLRRNQEPRDALYTWYINWLYEGLWRYYQFTGDEQIKAALLSYCRASTDYAGGFVCGGVGVGNLRWCAYGYDLTGDTLFLDMGRRMLDREIEMWVSGGALGPGGRKFRTLSMPQFIGVAGTTAPKAWKAGNLPTNRNGLNVDYIVVHPNIEQKLRPIYLLEEEDRAWRIHFAAHQTGQFAVFDPDGQCVVDVDLDWRKSLRGELTVPKDGKTGTYSLVCLDLNMTPYGKPEQLRDGAYIAWVNILHCDLKKIAYPAASGPGMHIGFDARSWCFGIPAGTDNVEIQWQPFRMETGGQRHFIIEQIDGPYRASSEDIPAVDRRTDELPDDAIIHSFIIPSAEKDRLFRCRPTTERDRLLTHAVLGTRSRFAIIGAPSYISASPENYFVPSPPKSYELP